MNCVTVFFDNKRSGGGDWVVILPTGPQSFEYRPLGLGADGDFGEAKELGRMLTRALLGWSRPAFRESGVNPYTERGWARCKVPLKHLPWGKDRGKT